MIISIQQVAPDGATARCNASRAIDRSLLTELQRGAGASCYGRVAPDGAESAIRNPKSAIGYVTIWLPRGPDAQLPITAENFPAVPPAITSLIAEGSVNFK